MTGSKPAASSIKVVAENALPERMTAPKDAVQPKKTAAIAKLDHVTLLKSLLDQPVKVPEPAPEIAPVRAPADKQKKADTTAPAVEEAPVTGKSRFHLRHFTMAASFVAVVLIPGLLATLYMCFVAQDQYHSSASFAVRSIEASSPSDVLGMFTQTSSGSTVSDSYILIDFIRSEQMVKMVDAEFGLENIYAVRGLDYYYALSPNSPIESKNEFWRSVVNVSFDQSSGIIELQVRAFEAEQARRIASFVIAASEKLVNDLSADARKGVLESAHQEVSIAERRLSQARSALLEYRDRAQEVDPTEGAKIATQLISSLEMQLVQLNSDLANARSQMSDDSPRVRLLSNHIASLEEQIQRERSRVGSGSSQATTKTRREDRGSDVANRIAEYETLETGREFAERAYTAALTSLEKARIDANNRQRYLAVFLKPTLSEWAQYPARIFYSLLVCGILCFFWAVGVMGYYNIRDRN